jgi:sporulation protein YlmC with PRC-barrel domain
MVEDCIIKLQMEKEIKALFKYYLGLVEDLKLDDEKHAAIRKKVLDSSNDTLREILQFLSYFDFVINAQRVEEASKRIIYRKTITSTPIIL